MAKKNAGLGFYKNILDSKSKNSILHNVYLLYIIFAIAVVDLFYLIMSSKWIETSIFFAVGIITSFFSKNMVVILIFAMVATFIFSNGAKSLEGFESATEAEENAVIGHVEDDNMGEEQHYDTANEEEQHHDNANKEEEQHQQQKHANKEEEQHHDKPSEQSNQTGKKVNIPGVTPFEILDQSAVTDKIDELINKQKILLEKMDQHKPILESITSLGKSIGIVK